MLVFFHRSTVYHYYNSKSKIIKLEFKGKFRQKFEEKIDELSCDGNCLTHKLFVMKYKELVVVKLNRLK